MSSQKIIFAGIAVVIIAALGWYITGQNDTAKMNSGENSGGGEETASGDAATDGGGSFVGSGSMLDILGLDKSLTCTYTWNDEETGEGSGVSYFDGERMRVDSSYMQDGGSFEMHMINDGMNLYSWNISNEGTFAFVTQNQIDKTNTESEEIEAREMETMDDFESVNNDVEYNCKAWRVDENMFIAPSDIEFVDMNSMFEGMLEGFEMPQ